MALTILERPRSCRLNATANSTYSISDSGYGFAVLSGGSGLSNGQTIFIDNTFESYRGFWLISSYGPNTFRLQQYSGADYVEYQQDQAAVELYVCIQDVDWSSVHLPIVYRLESNLWPTNTSDTIRAIVGFANDNGFVRITLNGAISAEAGDWLDIQATSEDELDGPFTILTRYSDTQYTIDAPYSVASGSAYTYATATAQKYYNNYTAVLRIYAGLAPTHLWAAKKQYELVTTLRIAPSTDNVVMLNVAEAIRQYIQVLENRPDYDTMPYDLDRFVQFYISYAESYDDSDGVDVTTFTSSFQSDYDFFQGWAADAKLEFRNLYSGFLSHYVYANQNNLARFLTEASRPVMFAGWYFDLSFIHSFSHAICKNETEYDEYGNELSETDELITGGTNNGVIRVPLATPASTAAYKEVFLKQAILITAPNTWSDVSGMTTMIKEATYIEATASLPTTYGARQILTNPFTISNFETITVDVNFLGGTLTGIVSIRLRMIDALGASRTFTHTVSGSIPGSPFTISVSDTDNAATGHSPTLSFVISIDATLINPGDDPQIRISPRVGDFIYGAVEVSETKTIDADSSCNPTGQYIYLTWKNALGGFDYWLFTGEKEHNINVIGTQEKERNIYPRWPRSYGNHNNSLSQETSRRSRRELVCHAENLTQAQVDMISGIKTSALVQQVVSRYNRRTWKLDTSGFTVRIDNQKLHTIDITLIATDEIPSQSL